MKRILILLLLSIMILSISSVSAVDNATDEVVSTAENSIDEVISADVCDDVVIAEDVADEVITGKISGFNTFIEETNNAFNIDEDEDILLASDNYSVNDYGEKSIISASNEGDDSLSLEEGNVLGSSPPPSTAYNVNVSDVTMYYGGIGKTIWMSINDARGYSYTNYNFYFKVYDSNNNLIINTRYSGSTVGQSLQYKIQKLLEIGVYTIKIVNFYDNQVMDTATLTVVSVPYSAYSVRINDTIIECGSNKSIVMSISPASGYNYKYDFYLRIYDSNNNLKINTRYYGSSSPYKKTYSPGATTLNPGVYTIKIVNTHEGHVMDTASLTLISVPYSAYSVSVSDTNLDYGVGGNIFVSIVPAKSNYFKYDFYLQILDSNNVEKVSKRYYNTVSSKKITHNIVFNSLSPGIYTIKIINSDDSHLMKTAKLTIDATTIETADLEDDCYKLIQFKVRVAKNNEFASGLKVTFIFNDKQYNVVTDSDGYGYLNMSLPAGNYSITTICNGVNNKNKISIKPRYLDNKFRNMYLPYVTTQYNTNEVFTYGWEGNFDGYFKIYNGNSLVYSRTLNTGGYVSDNFSYTKHDYKYSLNQLSVGSYTAKIVASNGTILKTTQIIISKASTELYKDSFTITKGYYLIFNNDVKNGNTGKTAKTAKGKVTLTINGKTYRANVKNGEYKISFGPPSKAKTYTCKITYSGDSNYKASSSKFKLIVKAPAKKKTTKKKTTNKKKSKKITKFTVVVPVKFNKKISRYYGSYKVTTHKYISKSYYGGKLANVRMLVYKNGKPLTGFKAKYIFYISSGKKIPITVNGNYWSRSITYNDALRVYKIKATIWP